MTRDAPHRSLDNGSETFPDMVTCPNGHANPAGWDTCGECGGSLEETGGLLEWFGRHIRLTVVITAAAVLALCFAGAIAIVTHGGESTRGDEQQAALQQWWSSARPQVDELGDALDEAERAIRHWDSAAFNDACQRIHDAAAVGVPAHLPAPDPQISAELSAAADDAHSASHMCLAAIARTHNNYDGEFTAATEQAAMHLKAARALIDLDVTA